MQLVTASMVSGYRKETSGVTIISEAGRQCALRLPWDCANINVVATPGGTVATQRAKDTVRWDTQPGVLYDVVCASFSK